MDPWTDRFEALCERIRRAACAQVAGELAREREGRGARGAARRAVHSGVGDVAFAVDAATEDAIDAWIDEIAREHPLSLLTEDTGWRHFGPDPRGIGERPVALPDFDHGGPRVAIDPVDGTRNLMTDLRPAWSVVSVAGPGRGEPRMADIELGIVSEIPTSLAARFRRLRASAPGDAAGGAGAPGDVGACTLEVRDAGDGRLLDTRALAATTDERADHGYFPFFRYLPSQREALARVEGAFFARLAEHEGADVRTCWDDQYICNAGQLVLLALGTYRMIVDVRGRLGARQAGSSVTSKPYDLAGAVLCARAAGCVVTDADGAELDFPIDCETPVDFVGWTNAPTRSRLEPHLRAALDASADFERS